jgi:hypothetical protein
LLEGCPDGQCRLAVLKTIAKRQPLLLEMAKLDGGANAMIAALKEAGKISEPEPDPPEDEGHFGGWFGEAGRARRQQEG